MLSQTFQSLSRLRDRFEAESDLQRGRFSASRFYFIGTQTPPEYTLGSSPADDAGSSIAQRYPTATIPAQVRRSEPIEFEPNQFLVYVLSTSSDSSDSFDAFEKLAGEAFEHASIALPEACANAQSIFGKASIRWLHFVFGVAMGAQGIEPSLHLEKGVWLKWGGRPGICLPDVKETIEGNHRSYGHGEAETHRVSYDRLDKDVFCASAAAINHLLSSGTEAPAGESRAFLSCSELAKKHNVSAEALRKRLDRYRIDHDAGYSEVTNQKPRDPRYLYSETAVQPLIEELKNSSGERPAK